MSFRVMRRAPWIALGAAGAYYFDGAQGAARRNEAAERIAALLDRGREQWRSALTAASSEDGSSGIDLDATANPSLDLSMSPAQVPPRSDAGRSERRRSEDPVEPLAR